MTRFAFSEISCKRRDSEESSSSSNSPRCSILCTAINNSNAPLTLIAVSYSDRTVSCYDTSGKQQTSKTIRNKTSNTHMLKWRPALQSIEENKMIIALALTSGIVSLWNYSFSKNERSSPAQLIAKANNLHSRGTTDATTHVTALQWNDSGTYLVVGNQVGSCTLWKFDDQELSLSFLTEYCSTEYHSITETMFHCLATDSTSTSTSHQLDHTSTGFLLFFGTGNGKVVQADFKGNHTILGSTSSSIEKMLIYEEKQLLIILTKSFMLIQAHIVPSTANDSKTSVSSPFLSKFKLSVSNHNNYIIFKNTVWVGPGVIASATGENVVRFWDINTNRNYVLPLNSSTTSSSTDDISNNGSKSADAVVTTCIAFQPQTGYLAVGTSAGAVCVWELRAWGASLDSSSTHILNDTSSKEQLPWKSLPASSIGCLGNNINAAIKIRWSSSSTGETPPLCLAVQTESYVSFAEQLELKFAFHYKAVAIQLTSNVVVVQHVARNEESRSSFFTIQVPASVTIEGLAVNETNLVVQGRKSIYVYEFRNEQWEHIADFTLSAISVVLYRDLLYILLEDKLLLTTKEGAQRLSLPLSGEKTGRPITMSVIQNFLIIATELGFIKVLDITHKDPSPVGKTIKISTICNCNNIFQPATVLAALTIRSIECNATGTFASLLVTESNDAKAKSYFHLVNILGGNQQCVTFSEGMVVSHFWDQLDPTILCCEVDTSETETTTKVLFVSPDLNTYSQDEFKLDKNHGAFVFGAQAPKIFYAVPNKFQYEDDGNILNCHVLKDFTGEDLSDTEGTRSLLNFAFFLVAGDVDKVCQSVLQKECAPSIWEKMAHMSVKKRRQDVVDICLAKMGHALGTAAVTLAKNEPEKNAALAAAAIHLGLLNEAETLYKDCGRYDLLAELHMSQSMWEKAFKVSEEYDKINLKYLYHQHAKYCCGVGNIKGAISSFEKAGTHAVMVPRMLLDLQLTNDLHNYVMEKADAKITRWWASYCESLGDHDEASRNYETAGDIASVVRLACSKGELPAASEIVLKSGDAAAAYQLASHLERMGEVHIHDAIQFYIKSGVLRQAIRLCKSHAEEHNNLMSLAMGSNSVSLVLDCATFFNEKGDLDKAIELFHKAGQTTTALSVCTSVLKWNDSIHRIVTSIAAGKLSRADTETCSKLLIEAGMYEEAIDLLFRNPATFARAVQVSSEHNILVTENVISKILAYSVSPAIQDDGEQTDTKWNLTEILIDLGKLCEHQAHYVAGCKAYTKAGEHVKAMKCLLQSGDLQSITSYAFASRMKENYIIAANYLQSALDWRNDAKITSSIIQLYTKGKAFQHLGRFFEACAETEINDYGDYEKAFAATEEAKKVIRILATRTSIDSAALLSLAAQQWLSTINQRLSVLRRFLDASQVLREEVPHDTERVAACLELLQDPEIMNGDIIRIGDSYGLLVEYYVNVAKRMDKASEFIENMIKAGLVLEDYIDLQWIAKVEAALVKRYFKEDLQAGSGGRQGKVVVEEGVIEEDMTY